MSGEYKLTDKAKQIIQDTDPALVADALHLAYEIGEDGTVSAQELEQRAGLTHEGAEEVIKALVYLGLIQPATLMQARGSRRHSRF